MWRSDDYVELKELEMSKRTSNCLKNDRLRWKWQVRRTPDAVLLRMPEFGKKCLKELRQLVPFELSDGEQPLGRESYEERDRLYKLVVSPTDWIDVLGGRETNA